MGERVSGFVMAVPTEEPVGRTAAARGAEPEELLEPHPPEQEGRAEEDRKTPPPAEAKSCSNTSKSQQLPNTKHSQSRR